MRKFKLINALGAEFDLMRKDALFTSPDGLGRSRSQGYEQAGDFLFRTTNKYKPSPITGEMNFKSYEVYAEFASFLEHEPLTLCYSPIGNDTWYFRDVTCETLSKSEPQAKSSWLICKIDFLPLGLWYEKTKVYKTEPAIEGNYFTFPLTFPFTFRDVESGNVLIKNNRPKSAPCKITFYGPLVNPSWALVHNGNTVSAGSLTAEISEAERIVIDADPANIQVSKFNPDGVRTDLSQYIDFESETFIYAPTGNSTLQVTHDGASEINVMVEVKQYADAV